MKLLGFMMCLICFTATASAQQQNITLAYLENDLMELKASDSQIALQFLAKELTRDSDVNMTILSIPTITEMRDLVKSGKVNYIIISSYNYISEKDNLSPYILNTMLAIQRSEKAQEEYVMVIKKEMPYNDISSLSGKRLSLNQDDLLLKLYLQFLVKKSSHLSLERFFKTIKNTKSASQTVLDVYFSTSDACIVPRHIMELAAELNPDITDKLKVVHHSGEKFVPALVLAFKGGSENITNMLNHNAEELNRTVRGQQILDMFHIHSLVTTSVNQLDYIVNMYSEYRNLHQGE